MDVAQELLKAWGPPAIIAVILWVMLFKSEKREEKKDTRIQMLENLLIESYDERISAAETISNAMHSNAAALLSLVNEIRGKR